MTTYLPKFAHAKRVNGEFAGYEIRDLEVYPTLEDMAEYLSDDFDWMEPRMVPGSFDALAVAKCLAYKVDGGYVLPTYWNPVVSGGTTEEPLTTDTLPIYEAAIKEGCVAIVDHEEMLHNVNPEYDEFYWIPSLVWENRERMWARLTEVELEDDEDPKEIELTFAIENSDDMVLETVGITVEFRTDFPDEWDARRPDIYEPGNVDTFCYYKKVRDGYVNVDQVVQELERGSCYWRNSTDWGDVISLYDGRTLNLLTGREWDDYAAREKNL